MHLFPISDLHINFYRDLYQYKDLDKLFGEFNDYDDLVVCCCGDIGERTNGLDFIRHLLDTFPHIQVAYVLGNHEYYCSIMSALEEDIVHQALYIPRLHVLTSNNPFTIINDVVFIGNTLWTDLCHGNEKVYNEVQHKMNDFRYIRTNNRLLTPEYMVDLHHQQSKQIFRILERKHKDKQVVLTHHQPFQPKVIDGVNYAFCADLEDKFNECQNLPIYWFCGHTHSSINTVRKYKYGNVRFVSNQYGYPQEYMSGYTINCILEI